MIKYGNFKIRKNNYQHKKFNYIKTELKYYNY